MEYSLAKDLQHLYLNNIKEASNGKKIVDNFLQKNDAHRLTRLLRHHDEASISDSETWDRDDIDFFLQYYSMVSLAFLLGGLTDEEFTAIRPEVNFYLGNLAIKRYYSYNYPLLLPQILLHCSVNNEGTPIKNKDEHILSKFYLFHQLNQSINNDNVYLFLWFLDGGSNRGFDIDDLTQTLQDPEKYSRLLKQSANTTMKRCLNGFFDYLEFIDDFNQFLKGIRDSTCQSAFWHFHAYWFLKTSAQLKVVLHNFFKGLRFFAKTTTSTGKVLMPQAVQSLQTGEQHYLKALDDIVFSEKYKTPLEAVFKSMTPAITVNKVKTVTKIDPNVEEMLDRPQNKKEKTRKEGRGATVIVTQNIETHVSMARTILSNNIEKHITIPQLARQAGINEVKLKLGFKQLYGQSIYHYQQQLRMEKAQDLLLTSNMSVMEVTNRLGYRNATSFVTIFKKHIGLTPTEWRKKYSKP